jgi:hypothetical protein
MHLADLPNRVFAAIVSSMSHSPNVTFDSPFQVHYATNLNIAPDEQMISCCSCPVTPNGLRSLSAQEDLINNTLIPATMATLSAGELSRFTKICAFILANGSGFGVCNSCRLGGLGAGKL